MAFDALTSSSQTAKFSKELELAKNVVRKQIKSSSKDGIITKYLEFIKEYL